MLWQNRSDFLTFYFFLKWDIPRRENEKLLEELSLYVLGLEKTIKEIKTKFQKQILDFQDQLIQLAEIKLGKIKPAWDYFS